MIWLVWSYVVGLFCYRRVVVRTKSGNKIVYRRPKGMTIEGYLKLFKNWTMTDYKLIELGDKKNRHLVWTRDVDTIEVH